MVNSEFLERCALGVFLREPGLVDECRLLGLTGGHFSEPLHREVFDLLGWVECSVDLGSRVRHVGEGIELNSGIFELFGGEDYLMDLVMVAPVGEDGYALVRDFLVSSATVH